MEIINKTESTQTENTNTKTTLPNDSSVKYWKKCAIFFFCITIISTFFLDQDIISFLFAHLFFLKPLRNFFNSYYYNLQQGANPITALRSSMILWGIIKTIFIVITTALFSYFIVKFSLFLENKYKIDKRKLLIRIIIVYLIISIIIGIFQVVVGGQPMYE